MNAQYDYVAEQYAIILGRSVALRPDQAKRGWALISREEERGGRHDTHGRFPPEDSMLIRLGLQEEPPLHQDLRQLAEEYPAETPCWPKGHRFAACLSHDVDRILGLPWQERCRQASSLFGKVSLGKTARLLLAAAGYGLGTACGKSDQAVYNFWLDEEARFGFHSTFFVLPERLASPSEHDHFIRYTDRVSLHGQRMTFGEATQRVRAMGWEIGLHGSYASAFDERIFRDEKGQLEALLEAPVLSTRQHFLRFDAGVTPRIQQAAGIQADSTLGFSDTIGCRAGMAFPFFWPEQDDLLEVPLIIQDIGLFAGLSGPETLTGAIQRARALISRIADIGGMVTLSWHTHPQIPGSRECYRALLEYIAEAGGWGCSVGELHAWWQARRDAVRAQDAVAAQPVPSREDI